jgi:hypothetical protein
MFGGSTFRKKMFLLGQSMATGQPVQGISASGSSSQAQAIQNFNGAIKVVDRALALVDETTPDDVLVETGKRLDGFGQGLGAMFIEAAIQKVDQIDHLGNVVKNSPTASQALALAQGDPEKFEQILGKVENGMGVVLAEMRLNKDQELMPMANEAMVGFMQAIDADPAARAKKEELMKPEGHLRPSDLPVLSSFLKDSADPNKTQRPTPEVLGVVERNPGAFAQYGIRGEEDMDKVISAQLDGDFQVWFDPKTKKMHVTQKGTVQPINAQAAGLIPMGDGVRLDASTADGLSPIAKGPSAKELEVLRNQAAAVNDVGRIVTRLQSSLSENIDATTWVQGNVGQLVNALRANVMATRRMLLPEGQDNLEFYLTSEDGENEFGQKVAPEVLFSKIAAEWRVDPANQSFFQRMAADQGQRIAISGDVVALAFAIAGTRESGGRFSENDIKAALKSIGENQDAALMGARLGTVLSDAIDTFVNKVDAFNNIQFQRVKGTEEEEGFRRLDGESLIRPEYRKAAALFSGKAELGIEAKADVAAEPKVLTRQEWTSLAQSDPREFWRKAGPIIDNQAGDPALYQLILEVVDDNREFLAPPKRGEK